MIEEKDANFLILGMVFSFCISFIFWILSTNNRLLITLIVSFSALVVSAVCVIFLLKQNKLSIFKSIFIIFAILLLTGSSYFIETKIFGFNQIVLFDEHIHLGDKKLDWFRPPNPLDVSFIEKEFNLPVHPKTARVRIFAKDVDPDFRSGPVLVLINKSPVEFLNNVKPFCDIPPVSEHEMGFQWAEIKVKSGFLNKGKNIISIYVLPTVNGLDDINISKVEFYYN